MKTLEIKKQESNKSVILVLLLVMIVFAQVLFEMRPAETSVFPNGQTELNPFFLSPQSNPNSEIGNLISFISAGEQKSEKDDDNLIRSENNSSIAKMNSYLIVEPESELALEEVMSIDFENANLIDAKSETDSQLQAMKTEARQLTDSAVSLYAFEKLINDCLIAEKETPLKIENWMINSKCWCPESEETLTVALSK